MISIKEIWSMIWGYKWWYVACVFVCLCIAGFYIYKTPNTYRRTAKVIIDESDQYSAMRNIGQLNAVMPGLRANNTVANEMEAIASPDLMQTVVERLGLETRYVESQFLRDVELYTNTPVEMRMVEGYPGTSFSFLLTKIGDKLLLEEFRYGGKEIEGKIEGILGEDIETPAGTLKLLPTLKIDNFKNPIRISWANSMAVAKGYCGKLSVSLSGKESTVVVLSMVDTYPQRASDILSSLIDVYNQEWISNKNRSSKKTSDFINERLVLIERELGGIENELKDYKASNKLSDMEAISKQYIQESSVYAAKSFEVNNQLSVAGFIKEYLTNPENAASLIPVNLGLQSQNASEQIKEYNEIVLQRDRLQKGSGVNNPIIADLNQSLELLRGAILRSIDNYISTLELQAQKIKSQEDQIMSRIASSSGQELQLLSIQRQQMVKESLYVFLLEKREENEIASLVNVGNTRVIMRPTGGSGPVAPIRSRVWLIAFALGLGIPFGVIFLLRILDTAVHAKGDFADSHVPFLAEIPLYAKKNRFGYYTMKEKLNHANTRILVEHAKRDMMNEAYRVFRTNLDMVIDKKPGEAYVTMFTSLNPNAGKTYTIMNIAASMSLKPSKVLLIDLDLRKATLSQTFGKTHRGVAAYLSGKENDFHQFIDKAIDRLENLDLLSVGKLPPNPTELLLTERFKTMIDQLRKEYDYIFIDCPPIDVVADSSIITKQVDMTVFVARAGLLDKRAVPYIDQIYREQKYTRMTLILNGVNYESRRYGGYGYGYGSGYGSGYGYGYGAGSGKE